MILLMLKRRLTYWKYKQRKRRANKIKYIDSKCNISDTAKVLSSELHNEITVGDHSVVHGSIISGNVTIGRRTTLWGPNIQVLGVKNEITIGNFCSIARDVTIQEYLHNYQNVSTSYIRSKLFNEPVHNDLVSNGSINIGHDVWIGAGAQIMSGVEIGNGAVIGANATVTKSVPPYAIVGGVPAKIIKYRFSEERIQEIIESQWWKWTDEKIIENKAFFKQRL